MPRYASFVDVADRNVQNAQELASIWGEIQTEFEQQGVELEDSYAVLGRYDFIVIFETPDHDSTFTASLMLHRHGLESETVEIMDTDDFALIVDDL